MEIRGECIDREHSPVTQELTFGPRHPLILWTISVKPELTVFYNSKKNWKHTNFFDIVLPRSEGLGQSGVENGFTICHLRMALVRGADVPCMLGLMVGDNAWLASKCQWRLWNDSGQVAALNCGVKVKESIAKDHKAGDQFIC